jgi:hypothetical protein
LTYDAATYKQSPPQSPCVIELGCEKSPIIGKSLIAFAATAAQQSAARTTVTAVMIKLVLSLERIDGADREDLNLAAS